MNHWKFNDRLTNDFLTCLRICLINIFWLESLHPKLITAFWFTWQPVACQPRRFIWTYSPAFGILIRERFPRSLLPRSERLSFPDVRPAATPTSAKKSLRYRLPLLAWVDRKIVDCKMLKCYFRGAHVLTQICGAVCVGRASLTSEKIGSETLTV